jgi:hypothetical protein
MMTKRSTALVMFLLAPPWGIFLLFCYWYFIDIDPPAKHTSVEIMDANGLPIHSVKRGQSIVLSRQSCVFDEGKAFYTRRLVAMDKKLIYFMPSGEVHLYKGCAKRFNSITIPAFVTPGLYEYVVTVVFVNNPLVETRMVLPIPTFEILP